MRINHVGEICAQALYQGQALVCNDAVVRESLDQAASEEVEHLAWTAQRIDELGSRTSYLNPIWYFGATARLGQTVSRETPPANKAPRRCNKGAAQAPMRRQRP